MLNIQVTLHIRFIIRTNSFLLALSVSQFRESSSQEQACHPRRAGLLGCLQGKTQPKGPPSPLHPRARGCALAESIPRTAKRHQHTTVAI